MLTTFIAGLVVGFVTSWKLTLVIFACTPLLIFIVMLLKNSTAAHEKDATDAYARAGDAASEAISCLTSAQAPPRSTARKASTSADGGASGNPRELTKAFARDVATTSSSGSFPL
jgi:ABC-type multidrug transport system fused ATPase/permease subunit